MLFRLHDSTRLQYSARIMRTPVPAVDKKPLTLGEIGYIAAAIDTGGTISVHVTKGHRRRDHGRIYVIPLVKVSNTRERQIAALHRLYPGTHYAEAPRSAYKPQWGWSVTGDAAIALLGLLRPHLIVKRKHADAVLAGAALKTRGKTTQAALKQWVARVRALNA